MVNRLVLVPYRFWLKLHMAYLPMCLYAVWAWLVPQLMAPSASVVTSVNVALTQSGVVAQDPPWLSSVITRWRHECKQRVPAGAPAGALPGPLAGNVVLPVAQDIHRWFRREIPSAAAYERMLFEVIGLALARTAVATRVSTALADQGFRTWLLTASAAAELALPPAPVPLAPDGAPGAGVAAAAGGDPAAASECSGPGGGGARAFRPVAPRYGSGCKT